MSEAIVYIAIGIVCLILPVLLNSCTQTAYREKCEAKGGEYYQSIDAGKSLCKLRQKAV